MSKDRKKPEHVYNGITEFPIDADPSMLIPKRRGVTSEDLEFLEEEMCTQDNRMTSNPLYIVLDSENSTRDRGCIFFTKKKADQFIEQYGYRFDDPQIYVASAKGDLVKALLLSLAKGELKLKPSDH